MYQAGIEGVKLFGELADFFVDHRGARPDGSFKGGFYWHNWPEMVEGNCFGCGADKLFFACASLSLFGSDPRARVPLAHVSGCTCVRKRHMSGAHVSGCTCVRTAHGRFFRGI